MDEREQVVLAQRGDAEAFTALVKRYYGMVYGLAYAHVHARPAAQDLAQEVFLLAWANRSRLKHPEGFLMWIRRIARNCSLNWLRSEDYRRKLSGRLARDFAEAPRKGPAAVAHLETEERQAKLRDGLRRLSPKLREAMVVYYLEGKSARETAEALGVKTETLRKRLVLGRSQLRAHWASEDDDEIQGVLPPIPGSGPDQVVMALSAGPAVPALGAYASGSDLHLWLHHVAHGGSLRLQDAARLLAVHVKGAAVGLAAVAVVLSGGAWLAYQASDGTHAPSAAAGAPSSEAGHAQHGIGVLSLEVDTSPIGPHCCVLAVFQDSPAAKAGLQPRDRIVAVDGAPLTRDFEANRRRIVGPPGTEVGLTILRSEGEGPPTNRFDVVLTRGPGQ